MGVSRDVSVILTVMVLLAYVVPLSQAVAQPASIAKSTTPVPRDAEWMKHHELINRRVKQGDIDLIFVGDSIAEGWKENETWKKYYGHRKAANLGISGDRTEHVLWRLDHGNIDGISPKVAVLMIGTNNSVGNEYSPQDIADGIRAIVFKLREKLPKTKVLLLAIFPRGERPNLKRMKNTAASKLIVDLADNKDIFFLDIGSSFLDDKGVISKEIMRDFSHLSPLGYKIWAKAMEPTLAELLGEKPIVD